MFISTLFDIQKLDKFFVSLRLLKIEPYYFFSLIDRSFCDLPNLLEQLRQIKEKKAFQFYILIHISMYV